jgi:hypothetical protein
MSNRMSSLVHTDAWSSFLGGGGGGVDKTSPFAHTHPPTKFIEKFGELIIILL